MSEKCRICDETFNKNTRKPVTCPYCQAVACITCIKKYCSNSTVEPHCMMPDCRVGWSIDFVRSTFPKSWLNKDYKNHRSQLLFEKELSKIRSTQKQCQIQLAYNAAQKEYSVIAENLKRIKNELTRVESEAQTALRDIWIFRDEDDPETMQKRKDQSFELEKTRQKLQAELDVCQKDASEYQAQFATYKAILAQDPTEDGSLFRLRCPRSTCKGFVRTTDNRCGLCTRAICEKCRREKPSEARSAPHVCDPDDVLSVNQMKLDTKPCPKCASLIHKLDGCSQIWCTVCHTAFSWETGEIERHVHNPHFYDYLRGQGRIVPRHDLPDCERLITDQNKFAVVKRIHALLPMEERETITNMVRLVLDLQPILEAPTKRDPNLDDRISYMNNDIDEQEFKARIYKRDKEISKQRHYRDVYDMLTNICDDLLHQLLNEKLTLDEVLQQLEPLREYANNALQSIATQFSSKPKSISPKYASLA